MVHHDVRLVLILRVAVLGFFIRCAHDALPVRKGMQEDAVCYQGRDRNPLRRLLYACNTCIFRIFAVFCLELNPTLVCPPWPSSTSNLSSALNRTTSSLSTTTEQNCPPENAHFLLRHCLPYVGRRASTFTFGPSSPAAYCRQ